MTEASQKVAIITGGSKGIGTGLVTATGGKAGAW